MKPYLRRLLSHWTFKAGAVKLSLEESRALHLGHFGIYTNFIALLSALSPCNLCICFFSFSFSGPGLCVGPARFVILLLGAGRACCLGALRHALGFKHLGTNQNRSRVCECLWHASSLALSLGPVEHDWLYKQQQQDTTNQDNDHGSLSRAMNPNIILQGSSGISICQKTVCWQQSGGLPSGATVASTRTCLPVMTIAPCQSMDTDDEATLPAIPKASS